MESRRALVLPNQADFFLRNPQYTVTGPAREQMIRFGGTYECEHSIAWTSASRVLVLPRGYDRTWLRDLHRQWKLIVPPIVTPAPVSGLLVQDLLSDDEALPHLQAALEGAEVIDILAYGPTPELYQLAKVIRGWGHEVELDTVSEKDYWVSSWLETKLSCLDLARMDPEINVAESAVVAERGELAGVAGWMLKRHTKIIVRTPFGVAGDGTAIVDNSPNSLDAMLRAVDADPFFVFPLLVQRFVSHSAGAGCPAADALIVADGVAEIVTCSLKVEDDHLFRSVNVGPDALPEVWANRLHALVERVGAAAAAMGYRGWLCVDCVAGADDKIYLTEINARRSGSTFAGSLLKSWGGSELLTLSAHFMVTVPPNLEYGRDIRPVFLRAWQAGKRVYPTTIRGLGWPEPMMAIMAAGATAAAAEDLVAEVAAELTGCPLREAGTAGISVVAPV